MADDPNKPESLPSVIEWLEGFLPFRLPRIALPQTAKNLDKAVAQLIAGGGENLAARLSGGTDQVKMLNKARSAYIERGTELIITGGSEQDQRALNYVLKNARLEQSNREHLIELTAEVIKHDPPSWDAKAEIDPDWLKVFAKFAADKSTDEVRALWAKILAGEIRAPGSTNLRTLALLATYNKNDVEAAHSVLNYAINRNFIYSFGRKYPKAPNSNGIPYAIVLNGIEIGIISKELVSLEFASDDREIFAFHKKGVVLHWGEVQGLEVAAYPLTQAGQDLLRLSRDFKEDDEYVRAFINCLKSNANGSRVTIGNLVLADDGETYQVTDQTDA